MAGCASSRVATTRRRGFALRRSTKLNAGQARHERAVHRSVAAVRRRGGSRLACPRAWRWTRLSRDRRLGADGAALDRMPAGARRRRSAAVRLRRGLAAPDAALDRARPGRRDLHHPPARRPLPRHSGAAEDLRPQRPRPAAADLRAAGLDRALRRRCGGSSAGSATRSSWSSSTRMSRSAHDGYEVRPFEVAHRMRAFGYALVEDERPGRFDPAEAESASGSRRVPTSSASRAARRSTAPTARSLRPR